MRSALTSFKARVALADHENFAATTDDLAVPMALLGGFERGKYFHGGVSGYGIEAAADCNVLVRKRKTSDFENLRATRLPICAVLYYRLCILCQIVRCRNNGNGPSNRTI